MESSRINWLREHASLFPGRKALFAAYGRLFPMPKTFNAFRSLLSRNGIRISRAAEKREWLAAHCRGVPYPRLAEAFSLRFGSRASVKSIQGYLYSMGLSNGLGRPKHNAARSAPVGSVSVWHHYGKRHYMYKFAEDGWRRSRAEIPESAALSLSSCPSAAAASAAQYLARRAFRSASRIVSKRH
jgi:hypothetical protein